MKKKTKIIITSITLAGLLFVRCENNYVYTPNYSIVENHNNKIWQAKYRYGNVYIVKDLNYIKKVDVNDIVVLDSRNDKDPDMTIISSYEVNDKEARNDILEIIMEYERLYPSDWNRSMESMRLEWLIHNALYNIDYKRNHTDNVDFDNSDESDYCYPILNKILML